MHKYVFSSCPTCSVATLTFEKKNTHLHRYVQVANAALSPPNSVPSGLSSFLLHVPLCLRESACVAILGRVDFPTCYNHTRCEETRTREAWLFLIRLEETARGEELVRMRAEERFTRALLDLELQDLRRLERARCETDETARMRSEDQAMRDLRRLEKTQMEEREAMRVEDVLARTRKSIEK